MNKIIATLLLTIWPSLMMHSQMLQSIVNSKPPVAGGGTWTHIADCNGNGALVCAFSVDPVAGDTVVIYLGATSNTFAPTCTDAAANVYTTASTAGNNTSIAFGAWIAYRLISPGSVNGKTITCIGTGGPYTDTYGSEFRDTGGTPTFDASYGSGSATVSDPSTGAIAIPTFTPANAGSLAFCGTLPNSGPISAPTGGGGTLSGWTGAVNSNSATEYKLSAPASSTNANFTDGTTSDGYVSVCGVFKP